MKFFLLLALAALPVSRAAADPLDEAFAKAHVSVEKQKLHFPPSTSRTLGPLLCAAIGIRAHAASDCCPGLRPEAQTDGSVICRDVEGDPSDKRCSFMGEYEDHRYGCCPGLEPARVTNDAYICK